MATAKKKTTRKTPTPRRPSAPSTIDTSRAWSLEELGPHLPALRDEDLALVREALIRAQSNEGLIALGAAFRTEDILAVAPSFAAGALFAIQSIAKPIPGLAPELLALLVREALELGRVNLSFEQQRRDVSTAILGRREELKSTNSRALRIRRSVALTLNRHVVPHGSKVRVELARAAAKAPTPASTVTSVRTVARVLVDLRKEPALVPVLDRYGYDEAFVGELEALAGEIERLDRAGAELTPPQRVDQRALDRQDGIVVALMRAIWWPLHDAQQDGSGIAPPPLGALERLVAGSRPEDDDEALVEPAPPEPVAS
ncbi:hypothetical protein [Sandaracinus amylolyticus]|uniref:hypothetical protein n=1 Tax=Sandaracinus amylolyticus TaxID=927083 RepID=UPI001F31F2A8|nr:hypothetical protein [Sandaracinus amylolyticus]UJR81890.1 Hypothetical protein I5071_39550 [Sandaracinus amylolyticus]